MYGAAILAALLGALATASGANGQEAAPPPTKTPPPSLPFTISVVLSDLEPFHDRERREARLFWVGLSASFERDGWGARAEARATEGRFRPYFSGSFWLQESYAFAKTPLGELRAGKLERVFGLEDDTFGGDVFSRLGARRNPDWGAALDGKRRVGKWDELDWRLSFSGGSDRVSWEDDGVDVESDPESRMRDALAVRARFRRNYGLTWLRPGVSARTERIVASDGSGGFRRTDGALELTAALGPIELGLEAAIRDGASPGEIRRPFRAGYEGGRGGGARLSAEFPTVTYRWAYTTWRTRETGRGDRMHQVGADWSPRKGIRATVEVELGSRELAGSERVRAARFGLSLSFP